MLYGHSRVPTPSADSFRRPRRDGCPAALLATSVLLVACTATMPGTGVSGSSLPSPTTTPLASVSLGLCGVIASLPDGPAAQRVFINVAHQGLHELAGDARLARSTSGRILEAMENVEADFARSPVDRAVGGDLTALKTAVDGALHELGVAPPSCAP